MHLFSWPKWHYGYVIVFCCCLIMAVNVGLVMSCAGIFYDAISTDLGVSVVDFGWYMSCIYSTSTVMLFFAGRLLEKYSARWLLTLSSVTVGVVFLAMSSFNALWEFYIAGACMGFAMAFLLFLSFPTLVNRWFKRKVGMFIGICSAASGIGGIFFNPLGAWLISEQGWRNTYLLFGAFILLIVSPLLGLLLRSRPEDIQVYPYGEAAVTTTVANPGNGNSYTEAVKMPIFYLILVFAFLMIAISTLNLFLPNYLRGISYTLEEASLSAAAVMIGVTIGKVILGMINDKSALAGVLTMTLLGSLGLLLLLLGHWGIWTTLVGSFFYGWAYAGMTVQTPMLVRTVFGYKEYAQIYSTVSIVLSFGGAVMAGGWGFLVGATSYTTVLLIGIFALLVSAALGVYALREKA